MTTRNALRHLTWLALAAVCAAACANQSTPSPSASRSNAMIDQTRETNKRTVGQLFETFNQGDLGAIDQLVGPEYVGAQGDRGPAGFKAVVVGLRTAFP